MKRMWSKNELKNIGTQQAKELIEAGQTTNAKPIYWHSVVLKRITEGALVYYFDFIILNNNETPFTLDSFSAWLEANPTAEIKIVQGYYRTYSSNLVSSFNRSALNIINVNTINLTTGAVEGSGVYMTEDSGAVLSDAVNKIN